MAQPPKSPAEERREVLHYAAVNGRSDVISVSLEQEAADAEGDVQALLSCQLDPSRGTALHEACRAGHVDVVRLLLLRGAPAHLQDSQGKPAYDVARGECPSDKFNALRSAFEAELFKRCASGDTVGAESLALGGLDLATCEQAGYTPWSWAELFEQNSTAERVRAIALGTATAGDGDPDTKSAEAEDATPEPDLPASDLDAAPCTRPALRMHVPELLIWPPIRCSGTSPEQVEVKLPMGSLVEVELPAFNVQLSAAVVRRLAACFEAVAEVTVVPRLRRTPFGLTPPVSVEELASPPIISLWQDASMLPGSFQLQVSSTGDLGHVSILGNDSAGFLAAVECLRQLLSLHSQPVQYSPGTGSPYSHSMFSLSLPEVCLQENLLAQEGTPSVFIDLWKLSSEEQSLVLHQLIHWRLSRVWVPLPNLIGNVPCQAALMQIHQARVKCFEAGIELVPVVVSSWLEVPWALVDLLNQFQGCNHLSVCLDNSGVLGDIAPALTQLNELWKLISAAGLQDVRLNICLPLNRGSASGRLLEIVQGVAFARIGRRTLPPKLSILFETNLCSASGDTADGDASDALVCASAHGIPVGLLLRSTSSVELPPFVWPAQGANVRAESFSRILRSQTSNFDSLASHSVVEVPTFGAPWCGAGTAWHPCWCSLTIFLGAGVMKQPKAAKAALGLTADMGTEKSSKASESKRLAQLLQAQLLRPSAKISDRPWEANHVFDMRSALALELWDSPAGYAECSPDLLKSLLGLLAGQMPVLGTGKEREAVIGAANIFYSQLSDRRQRLRAFSEDLSRLDAVPDGEGAAACAAKCGEGGVACAPNASMPTASTLHAAALVGVEWLRFACRLLLLVAKHAPAYSGSNGTGQDGMPVEADRKSSILILRQGLQALPATKGSDVRNTFLALVHRTITGVLELGDSEWWEEPEDGTPSITSKFGVASNRRQAAEALWTRGLGLGAALDLQPWASLI